VTLARRREQLGIALFCEAPAKPLHHEGHEDHEAGRLKITVLGIDIMPPQKIFMPFMRFMVNKPCWLLNAEG